MNPGIDHIVRQQSAPFYSKSLIFSNDTLMSGSTIQSVFDLFDSGDKGSAVMFSKIYFKNPETDKLNPDAQLWFAIFHLVGGAINDVPVDATSYPHRDGLVGQLP